MIPKRFNILGHTVNVKLHNDSDTTLDALNAIGTYVDSKKEINVLAQKNTPQSYIETTYYHEVVHCILAHMKHELNSNEEFVDSFAEHLYQILSTSRGEQ